MSFFLSPGGAAVRSLGREPQDMDKKKELKPRRGDSGVGISAVVGYAAPFGHARKLKNHNLLENN